MVVAMLLVRHDLASAAFVRREIAADLADRSLTQNSVDDVVLVASELVGNAVVHTIGSDGALDVAWDVHDDAVTVRVNDGSEQLPRLTQAEGNATGGRGLAIVAAIAAEWGVHDAPNGKQVWARVPISHTAVPHGATAGARAR